MALLLIVWLPHNDIQWSNLNAYCPGSCHFSRQSTNNDFMYDSVWISCSAPNSCRNFWLHSENIIGAQGARAVGKRASQLSARLKFNSIAPVIMRFNFMHLSSLPGSESIIDDRLNALSSERRFHLETHNHRPSIRFLQASSRRTPSPASELENFPSKITCRCQKQAASGRHSSMKYKARLWGEC